MDKLKKSTAPRFYLSIFLLLHTFFWTAGPYWTRPSLPHDTLESITWGMQWQLGYAKQPFLTAWVSAAVFKIAQSDWAIYLLAQLLIAITFLAVWSLAKQFLSLSKALIATLTLEGVLFYNINSFNLTPDTMQSPLWAWLVFFFYKALTTKKITYWMLTGMFAALCLCTKYQVLILFIPMVFFCLCNQTARTHFKKPGIYLGIGIFMLVSLPHFIWLFEHHFISVEYIKGLSTEYTPHKGPWSYLYYPLLLLGTAFVHILGVMVLLWPFYKSRKRGASLDSFQWQFLLYMGLGPFIFSIVLCSFTGDYIPARWLTPYFFLISIICVSYLNPMLNKKILKQFAITFVLYSALLCLFRMIVLTHFTRVNNDAFLPNKTIANSLNTLWQHYYHHPIPYLAGSSYLVVSVLPYLSEPAMPYLNWQVQENSWINESELRRKGGMFIWDVDLNFAWDKASREHATLSNHILDRFPELIRLPDLTFYRLSNQTPFKIGVALLPPSRHLIH